MALDFVGSAAPLTANGLAAVTERLDIKASEIWAVLTVETKCCGFIEDRGRCILYERHAFSRETNRRFDRSAPDVSNPSSGDTGLPGPISTTD